MTSCFCAIPDLHPTTLSRDKDCGRCRLLLRVFLRQSSREGVSLPPPYTTTAALRVRVLCSRTACFVLGYNQVFPPLKN